MDSSIKLKLNVIFTIKCQTFNEILVKHFHFVKSGQTFLTKKTCLLENFQASLSVMLHFWLKKLSKGSLFLF